MKSLRMQQKARKLIPGSTQLLSKRPEMFAPHQWPGYYSKARGVETWDLDRKKYIDMSICGIGANILGFADPDVNAAVKKVVDAGSSCSLNAPEEIELAELFCRMHPWADMVRYSRSGGESMSIAVRIARAHTKKDAVAFCGYHGWHDWYLAANLATDRALDGHLLPGLEPRGVPRGLQGTALPFCYNHLEELEALVKKHRSKLAAIVMEPIRDHYPQPGFLERIRRIADKEKIVLIFDEITAALRLNSKGAHALFNVNPDIAVFAKAISNGYPMGVIIGRKKVMQAAQSTFISSTHWTERIGPVAALATIKKHTKYNVAEHLIRIGTRIQDGWRHAAAEAGLNIAVVGIAPLSHFSFADKHGMAMMTLFTQTMLQRGFLASGRFYASFSHTDKHVSAYLHEVHDIFGHIAKARAKNKIKHYLKGPIAHSGFQRLT